jgi:hypothetical protein
MLLGVSYGDMPRSLFDIFLKFDDNYKIPVIRKSAERKVKNYV